MEAVEHLYVLAKWTGKNYLYAVVRSTGYDVTDKIANAATFAEMGTAGFMLSVLHDDDPGEFTGYRVREKVDGKVKPD